MTSLELIIRPFNSGDVTPPTRDAVRGGSTVPETIVLSFGEAGTTKTFNGSSSSAVTSYSHDEIKEKSRETEKKRITNPDDESQFVEVELIKKLTTEQGEGATYKKSNYTFKNK